MRFLGNDVKVMQPHVLQSVLGADGLPAVTFEPKVTHDPGLNPGNIEKEEYVRLVVAKAKERQVPIRIGVNCGSVARRRRSSAGSSSCCRHSRA
jgi:hypothetical protein